MRQCLLEILTDLNYEQFNQRHFFCLTFSQPKDSQRPKEQKEYYHHLLLFFLFVFFKGMWSGFSSLNSASETFEAELFALVATEVVYNKVMWLDDVLLSISSIYCRLMPRVVIQWLGLTCDLPLENNKKREFLHRDQSNRSGLKGWKPQMSSDQCHHLYYTTCNSNLQKERVFISLWLNEHSALCYVFTCVMLLQMFSLG